MRFVRKSLVLLYCGLQALAAPADLPVKDLGGGRLQVGLVVIDAKARQVSFPAAVNMRGGPVEYAVVTSGGKVHESIFRTDAEPAHIHAAMLLLGVKPETNTEAAIFFDPKREIPGARVKIEVVIPGPAARTNLVERFLFNTQARAPADDRKIPHWIYNGSKTSDGVFLAQREGSIVSLIADPAALVNNPREDRENDELWSANADELPPEGTLVEVRFRLMDGMGKPAG